MHISLATVNGYCCSTPDPGTSHAPDTSITETTRDDWQVRGKGAGLSSSRDHRINEVLGVVHYLPRVRRLFERWTVNGGRTLVAGVTGERKEVSVHGYNEYAIFTGERQNRLKSRRGNRRPIARHTQRMSRNIGTNCSRRISMIAEDRIAAAPFTSDLHSKLVFYDWRVHRALCLFPAPNAFDDGTRFDGHVYDDATLMPWTQAQRYTLVNSSPPCSDTNL